MLTQTNTNGVEFVYNNLQVAVQSGSNTNADVALPYVQPLNIQAALQVTGNEPGGASFRKEVNVVAPSTANAAILLSDIETHASYLNYTKSGAFIVALSGTNAVTVPLTNTATNSTSQAGDTAFATWNQIIFWNLSGLDGNNSASLTVGPSGTNGANLQMGSTNGTLNHITVDGSSCWVSKSVNGVTVNAADNAVLITPSANGTFGMVVLGS